MKAVKDYFIIIAFLLFIAFIIPIGSSFFQTILADLRYAAMSEKTASKDILVLKENDFFRFDISEYSKLDDLINTLFYPCYNELLTALDNINASVNESDKLKDNIQFFYFIVSRWQAYISSEIYNYNGKTVELLNFINDDFIIIKNSISKVLSSRLDSEIQVANQNILVSNIKDFFHKYCYILLTLFNDINDNKTLMTLYEDVVNTLNDINNDPLIDLETPYFSLPIEYSEKKEEQIFDYIKNGKRDARSVMALILLYIKMKNIADAELLYYKIIAPMLLVNSQDKELSRTISLMLDDIRHNNPNAILDKTIINTDTNLNVEIDEHYFIHNPEKEKDVFLFLPYEKNNIVLISLTDKNNENLILKNFESSWKDSCYIQFSCHDELKEFNLVYRVINFFDYSDKFGTYSYRYGSITQNNNFSCEIVISSFYKASTFYEAPSKIKDDKENYEQIIFWLNPTIPYKIDALGFSDYKNGVAGEIISIRLLYYKWLYLILVLFLFILLFAVTSKVIENIIIYEISFLIISGITLFFLFWDIHFVNIIQFFTKPLSNTIIRIILIILYLVGAYLIGIIDFAKGNKYFRILSSIILLSIMAYGINLFFHNTDQTNIINKIIFSLNVVYFYYIIIQHLSKQMDISKTILLLMTFSIIFVSLNIFRVFKTVFISKSTLNLLGLFAGLFFTFIICLCILIENKKLRNVKDQTGLELFIDSLSIKFKGKALPVAYIFMLSFIALSLISEYVFFTFIPQLIIAILAPRIEKAINSGKFFGKPKNIDIKSENNA